MLNEKKNMLQNSSQLNKSKVMFCKCFSPKEYLHLRPPPLKPFKLAGWPMVCVASL